MSNLIQQLDEIAPGWRRKYGPDPIEAAYELGLLDDPGDGYDEYVEVDLTDDLDAWRRYTESYEGEE